MYGFPNLITVYATINFVLFNAQSFVDSFSAGLYKEYTSKGIIVQVSFHAVYYQFLLYIHLPFSSFQCVSPFYVSTAMSGIGSTNFWVPEPVAFARAAVATIGIKRFTHGCFSHALQVNQCVFDHFPSL